MNLLGGTDAFMSIASFFFFIKTEISKLEHSFHTGQPNYLYLFYFGGEGGGASLATWDSCLGSDWNILTGVEA